MESQNNLRYKILGKNKENRNNDTEIISPEFAALLNKRTILY